MGRARGAARLARVQGRATAAFMPVAVPAANVVAALVFVTGTYH
jgi:hypothetical protein